MRHHRDPLEDLARIDPINGDRLASDWSDSQTSQTLLEEITAMPFTTQAEPAIDTDHSFEVAPGRRRRLSLKLAVGLAVAAATLVVAQGIIFSDAPAFAVRQLDNGVVEIDARPQLRDGDALAEELREYGIDVRVTTVPSSPSAVGEVAVYSADTGATLPAGLTIGGDGTPDVFRLQIDPSVFTGQLILEFHVAAHEGESYQLAEEVFEPGEVLGGLQCALGEPVRTEQLLPYLAELGITPVWTVVTPTDDPYVTNHQQVDTVPDGEVLSGYARDATTVEFNVVRDEVVLPDIYQARLSDLPCTPGQAAEWD